MFICGQLCVSIGTLYYLSAMASHLPLALVCYTCPTHYPRVCGVICYIQCILNVIYRIQLL